MAVFEFKLQAKEKRTRLTFWRRESPTCVEPKNKNKIQLTTPPHCFWGLFLSVPKILKNFTITKKQFILRGFWCHFWISHAHELSCSNFHASSYSRNDFIRKNVISLLANFDAIRDIPQILKMLSFLNRVDLHAQIFRINLFLWYLQLVSFSRKSER